MKGNEKVPNFFTDKELVGAGTKQNIGQTRGYCFAQLCLNSVDLT